MKSFAVLYKLPDGEFCIRLFDDLLEARDFHRVASSQSEIAVVFDADFATSVYVEFWR